jgi:hypothetical protein
MSTSIPARIYTIVDKVGRLKGQLYADIFVLAGDGTQPYATLTPAKPEDAQLGLVGGVPIFGSETLMNLFQIKIEASDICGMKMYLTSADLVAGS